jgi:pseudouridine-5'-phosphate glycosidase
VSDRVVVGTEVASAIAAGDPVVALETSVVGQGLPAPHNWECVERMEGAIRGHDAVPAWVGVVDGSVVVGLSEPQLRGFAEPGRASKVARRDLPPAVATGALGATTVSATIWAASRGGVAVGTTGGIGGVHPGRFPDVSADLLELASTPGLLVCSGPKSIIDAEATIEKLEELGVVVVGYGVDRLPHFLARESNVELEHRVDDPAAAASVLRASRELELRSTLLVCNPVPPDAAMPADEVAGATREAESRADAAGIRGKARTPFLLAALAEITDGRSIAANLALLEDNARVAAEIAAAT